VKKVWFERAVPVTQLKKKSIGSLMESRKSLALELVELELLSFELLNLENLTVGKGAGLASSGEYRQQSAGQAPFLTVRLRPSWFFKRQRSKSKDQKPIPTD